MQIRLLPSSETERYAVWLAAHPDATLWQSLAWQSYQKALGRETRLYVGEENGEIRTSALAIIDRTAFGLSTWDIPRGPLVALGCELTAVSTLLERIMRDAKQDKCLTLYLSPLAPLNTQSLKLKTSSRHEQPEATRMLDLTFDDEALLTQMHPKGRYNIKVSEKHGVRVEQAADVEAFAELMEETAGRDGFHAPGKRQLQTFLTDLPGSFLLLAYAAGGNMPIAGLLGVAHGHTGIYYYGASAYAHRALMAPFALQWEAMRLCRERGCTRYDLLGIAPPESDEDHPWRGISSFKEKFGGAVIVYPPERQIVLRPTMCRFLSIKRKILG